MNLLTRDGEGGESSAIEIPGWTLPGFANELFVNEKLSEKFSNRNSQLDAKQEPNGKDTRCISIFILISESLQSPTRFMVHFHVKHW